MDNQTTGILGVGNYLMKDEGFGCHVISYIEKNMKIPQGIEILDGGSAGIQLLPFFRNCNRLLIIDAIKMEEPPGTLVTFSKSDFQTVAHGQRTSPHQIGILELLAIMEFDGSMPDTSFLCAVPKEISEGVELTPELQAQVPRAADHALAWATKKQNIFNGMDIQTNNG